MSGPGVHHGQQGMGGHHGQQGMHGGGGGGGPGGPAGGGGGLRPNPFAQPHFPVSYTGFMLRRGLSLPGQRGDWTQPQVESYLTSAEKAQAIKSKMKGYDWTTVYNALKHDSQRNAISKVLRDQRMTEKNPYATWDYVAILPRRETVRGTLGYASEITCITVILKRQPKPDPSVQLAQPLGGAMDATQSFFAPVQNQHIPMPQSQPMDYGHGPSGPPPLNSMPPPPPRGMPQGGNPGLGQNNPKFQTPNDSAGGMKGNNTMKGGLPHGQPIPPRTMTPKGNSARNSTEHLDRGGNGKWKNSSLETDSSDSDSSRIFNMNDVRQGPGKNKNQDQNLGSKNAAPPPIMRKTSTTNIDTKKGQKFEKEVTEHFRPRKPRSSSSDSDDSYDKLDEYSRKSYSTRGTEYSTDSEDHPYHRARSQDRFRRNHREYKDRTRSRTRDRRSRDRRRSRSREPPRMKRRLSERHRRSSPFHGSTSSFESGSDRGKTVVYQYHYHNGKPVMQDYRYSTPPSPGSSTGSLWADQYSPTSASRPSQWIDNGVFDMSPLNTAMPAAPMAADYAKQERKLRRRQQAAEAYMRAEEQRNVTAKMVDAFDRGVRAARRDEDGLHFSEELGRQRRDENELELQRLRRELAREQKRKADEVAERQRRDFRERDRLSSYLDDPEYPSRFDASYGETGAAYSMRSTTDPWYP